MKRVIMTTYLTRKGDPQLKRRYYPDRPDRMAHWYKGLESLQERGVVFHDELSDAYQSWYPAVEFVNVGKYKYSANDGRFGMFLDYLRGHPDIEQVWMTDLFDVRINSIPELDDKYKLYVMTEPSANPQSGASGLWSRERRWVRATLRRINQDGKELLGKPMYNPGVWGGKREYVVPVLEEVVKKFEEYDVGDTNCNMFVFNQVLYQMFREGEVFTGYPLHSEFKRYEDRTDVNFNHK